MRSESIESRIGLSRLGIKNENPDVLVVDISQSNHPTRLNSRNSPIILEDCSTAKYCLSVLFEQLVYRGRINSAIPHFLENNNKTIDY